MAQIRKRGTSWLARVRIDGRDVSKTFKQTDGGKIAAQRWAAKQEADVSATAMGKPGSGTFGDLLDRYIREVVPTKRGARPEALRLKSIAADKKLADVPLAKLAPSHFAQWRDRRLQEVSGASVLREMNSLSAVCTRAMREWGSLPVHPMKGVTRPPDSQPRQRRISDDEISRLLLTLGYEDGGSLESKSARVGAALLFALETGMRAGEICGLRQRDVKGRIAHLGATKNGTSRDVPLSSKARAILDALGARDPFFDLEPKSLDALFRKARDRAQIEGLHFHDSRREALTRLAAIFQNPMDLARISGHKDLRILSSVYYSPKPEDLLARLS